MIPEGWSESNLGLISDIKRGASPRPINDSKWFSNSGHGWIRISDVSSSYKILKKTVQYLSKEGVSKSVIVTSGDLIMSICGSIGKPVIIGIDACIHDGFVLFSNIDSSTTSSFLYYFLQKESSSFSAQGQPGTQKNINTTIIKKKKILLPPLSEQQKITLIMTTVDDVILTTQKVIDQAKKVKKGFLQKLLSIGIGHCKYKDSEIGKIPLNWKVTRLGIIYSHRKEYGNSKYPAVSVTLHNGLVMRDSLDRNLISELSPEKHSLVRKGDLVYNMMRMWQGASGVATYECIVSPAYVVCEPNEEILPAYSAYLFKAPQVIYELKNHSKGITKDRLRLYFNDFSKIKIPLPPIEEQARIVSLFDSLDSLLEKNNSILETYKDLKKGLMQDLLTGKVRVKV